MLWQHSIGPNKYLAISVKLSMQETTPREVQKFEPRRDCTPNPRTREVKIQSRLTNDSECSLPPQ